MCVNLALDGRPIEEIYHFYSCVCVCARACVRSYQQRPPSHHRNITCLFACSLTVKLPTPPASPLNETQLMISDENLIVWSSVWGSGALGKIVFVLFLIMEAELKCETRREKNLEKVTDEGFVCVCMSLFVGFWTYLWEDRKSGEPFGLCCSCHPCYVGNYSNVI